MQRGASICTQKQVNCELVTVENTSAQSMGHQKIDLIIIHMSERAERSKWLFFSVNLNALGSSQMYFC